jgi:hypothetical protein
MNRRIVITAIAIVAALGLFGFLAVTITQTADAWHSNFGTKKECVDFFKNVIGNTTSQAQVMCNKIVSH